MQQVWSPLGYLVPGVMLFGIGTYVNGACVFGSVGHFGNGNIGFGFAFLGIFVVFYIESLLDLLSDQPPTSASLPLGPVLLAIALLAILALRLLAEPSPRRLGRYRRVRAEDQALQEGRHLLSRRSTASVSRLGHHGVCLVTGALVNDRGVLAG